VNSVKEHAADNCKFFSETCTYDDDYDYGI